MGGDKKDEHREVFVHMNDDAANKQYEFPTNFIKTAKFNLLTFLPLDLYHQFKKISNFYFLVNMIFAVIPDVAPISPATAILPLVVVIGVALIKDGYEDFQRHKSDTRANATKTKVVRNKGSADSPQWELTTVESADVRAGDITKIEMGDEIRADVILFSSNIVECQAYIDTCNLDGETNLKNKRGVEGTWDMNSVEACVAQKIVLKTSPPSAHLLHWGGVLYVGGEMGSETNPPVQHAVGIDQFLYRSCILRNTEWIWGMVAFAGVDTKMFKNLQEKPPKSSNLDLKLNKLIVAVLVVQHILLFIMASMAVYWVKDNEDHWYITFYLTKRSSVGVWFYRYLTYFILMSYMIPISLFVTIELCKLAQAAFMMWDLEMQLWMQVGSSEGGWKHCVPNSSDLNEQLSQTKFIFSDKTGTLTENVMKFKDGDALGCPIKSDNWELSKAALKDPKTKDQVSMYLKALALCHTINPFPIKNEDGSLTGKIKYEGSSPDEVALVETAAEHGIVLVDRTTKTMAIDVDGEREVYTILATLEFTPDRKMMSIVLRNPEGVIWMFTKGADSFVIPRMFNGPPNTDILPTTMEALKEMAVIGLRTLIVCNRVLSEEEFSAWNNKFEEVGKELVDRAAKVDTVCLELESDMLLVGATAIEDKLQDKVPETLKFFLAAGVVVWMLTGDKRETAVTIAATSSLTNPQTDHIDHIDIGDMLPVVELVDDKGKKKTVANPDAIPIVERQLRAVKANALADDGKQVTFVIDGPAITVAMNIDAGLRDLFVEVSQMVNSAVCCRLTPLQKANVVNMFQTCTGSTALAIGDGANDVSMIQEGRVGVGIVGLEGAQAALAADYAIPRFKHLRRLCAVHGRYATCRNALCIKFSFYKNILLSLMQFYYSFYTGFSGQTMFNGWLLSFYNFAFTSLPPMFVGFFEKDLPEEALMAEATLFTPLGDGLYFDVPAIAQWFVEAVVHSLVLFFALYPTALRQDNHERIIDNLSFGTISISAMVILVLTKLALHIRWWVVPQAAIIIFSYLLYVVFLVVYAAIPSLFGETEFHGTVFFLMSDAKFWFYIIFITLGLLVPIDLSIIFIQRTFAPTLRDKYQLKYEESM